MTILQSRAQFPMVALSFLFYSRPLYEAMIYWVYCDYSLLEAPWSKLPVLLDLIHFIPYSPTSNMDLKLCIAFCVGLLDLHHNKCVTESSSATWQNLK